MQAFLKFALLRWLIHFWSKNFSGVLSSLLLKARNFFAAVFRFVRMSTLTKPSLDSASSMFSAVSSKVFLKIFVIIFFVVLITASKSLLTLKKIEFQKNSSIIYAISTFHINIDHRNGNRFWSHLTWAHISLPLGLFLRPFVLYMSPNKHLNASQNWLCASRWF